MRKKKRPGHYCKICGERKANEKFSGKGHAAHICKACQLLPAEEQADMRRIRDVERIMDRFPFTRNDWDLLEKYAKKYANKESGQFAQEILDSRRSSPSFDDDEEEFYEEQLFAELEPDTKEEIRIWLHEELFEYLLRYNKEPEGKHKQKITTLICKSVAESFYTRMQPDETFELFWKEVISEVKEELASEEFNEDDSEKEI